MDTDLRTSLYWPDLPIFPTPEKDISAYSMPYHWGPFVLITAVFIHFSSSWFPLVPIFFMAFWSLMEAGMWTLCRQLSLIAQLSHLSIALKSSKKPYPQGHLCPPSLQDLEPMRLLTVDYWLLPLLVQNEISSLFDKTLSPIHIRPSTVRRVIW
jgi:hypothetical protein